MLTNFGEKIFLKEKKLKALKWNGVTIQIWTLIKIVYFIRLIVKEYNFNIHGSVHRSMTQ